MRPDNSSLTLLFKSKKLLIYTPLLFSILVAIPSLASAQSTPVTYSTPDYVYPDNNGYYNVKDEPYGCYGDGRHDDTACIKEAMDAAMRVAATGARHATLYFPEGTYLISDSLLWATYGNNDAVVKAKVDTSRGCITGFTIANGGSGYVAQPGLYITGGGGSGASFYTTLNSGSVTGIQAGLGNLGTATCAGQGYKSVPTVKVLNWKAYLRFEGQNKANTIIKLTDNNAKFQNANCNVSPRGDSQAREYCQAMIMTGNEQARNSFGLGESAYEDDVWNLTINTGSGNPGAIALDWVGSNRASVKNVNIQSGDGRGRCGLSVARSSSAGTGPDYVKNVAIKGFDYGIYANADAHEVGNTFEYIDLTNIHTAGVVNGGMPNWFRHVSANMKVPVFINQGTGGSLLVTDGYFTGGASNITAIQAPATSTKGVLFLRNIKTSGYAAALAVDTANKIVPGANISEYAFPAATSQFPSSLTSLDMDNVPNTPEYMDSNFSNWASVGSYGAACAPNSRKDATSCIQAAMNSGKPIIYFPFGNYWTSSTIHVPSSVRVVLGMNSFVSSGTSPGAAPNGDGNHKATYCTIQFDGAGSHSVELRNFSFLQATQSNTFCYNGSAPLVLADILGAIKISNTASGTGTIYLENVAVPDATYNLRSNQHVYARQYDVESGTKVHVTLNGGIFWMFAFKSEGAGLLWNVSNATFELLGSFSSGAGGPSPDPAFAFKNSNFTLAAVTAKSSGWKTVISETRGSTVLKAAPNGLWIGGIGYGLYSGDN
jgi:pectate lyase-like protein